MNWDDLKYFLAVARCGSITGGAKELGVQHSTVSRRLRALEARLVTRLIERKNSGYELTAAGEDLKCVAMRIEQEVLEADGALSGHDNKLSGKLRVSAINNMATTVLMPMFTGFSKSHPGIELHIQVSNKYVSLTERQADVVIRLTNTPQETLVGKRLVTVASTVYGSRPYLKRLRSARQKPKWLGIECCGFHESWTKAACGNRDQNFFVDDTLLTTAALKQGLGVAYLPCFLGDGDPDLERLSPPDPKLDLGLWLLYHPDLRHTQRIRIFRDHMIEQMARKKNVFEGKVK